MDPDYEKKLREIAEWERQRKEAEARDKPYRKGGMNSERMPFGCWIWVAITAAIVFWLFKKHFGI